MAQLEVKIPSIDKKSGKRLVSYASLFSRITLPVEQTRSPTLTIEIAKDVASLLVAIDRNMHGKPENYTSFILQVATNAKNKYTSRIYKLISSWKKKGGFYVPINDFREWIQFGNKYQDYREMKRRILMPVQQKLENQADVESPASTS
jgi:plasmid replication initiation protein